MRHAATIANESLFVFFLTAAPLKDDNFCCFTAGLYSFSFMLPV